MTVGWSERPEGAQPMVDRRRRHAVGNWTGIFEAAVPPDEAFSYLLRTLDRQSSGSLRGVDRETGQALSEPRHSTRPPHRTAPSAPPKFDLPLRPWTGSQRRALHAIDRQDQIGTGSTVPRHPARPGCPQLSLTQPAPTTTPHPVARHVTASSIRRLPPIINKPFPIGR